MACTQGGTVHYRRFDGSRTQKCAEMRPYTTAPAYCSQLYSARYQFNVEYTNGPCCPVQSGTYSSPTYCWRRRLTFAPPCVGNFTCCCVLHKGRQTMVLKGPEGNPRISILGHLFEAEDGGPGVFPPDLFFYTIDRRSSLVHCNKENRHRRKPCSRQRQMRV